MNNFGERLKFFRIHILKMKRNDFCEAFKLPIVSVQGWENNGINASKKNMDRIKQIFIDKGVSFDEKWLFGGEGNPLELLKNSHKNGDSDIRMTDPEEFIYRINSYTYEPLLKKNSSLLLFPVDVKDLDCPSFVGLKDALGTMHFGILSLTLTKDYILEAYSQRSFYKLIVKEDNHVFLIKKAALYNHAQNLDPLTKVAG